jgi:hypothetical protein
MFKISTHWKTGHQWASVNNLLLCGTALALLQRQTPFYLCVGSGGHCDKCDDGNTITTRSIDLGSIAPAGELCLKVLNCNAAFALPKEEINTKYHTF